MNSTSSAPVTISVTVAAVDSAPLVSFSWLLRSASMAELPALVIWSLLRCAGPSISQCARPRCWRDLFDQSGQPVDELADDERQHAADDRDPAQQHQRHRAAAGGAAAVQEVDGGQSATRPASDARATGTTMISSRLDHPEHRDDEREDHQQAPRPRRRLAD